MKKSFVSVLGIVVLFTVVTMTEAPAAEHEEHHPAAEQGATAAEGQPTAPSQMMPGMMEMMGQGRGMMKRDLSCLQPSSPSGMMHMMSDAVPGRMMMDSGKMHRMMDREFFLDRSAELGLSQKQVADLRDIRSDCRKDNIRTAAEAKIARLELDDLLESKGWSVQEAEELIRRIETLQGDMKVRHLQAVKAAEKVLSEEQLDKARMDPKGMEMEELF